jgi:glycosyltransferase involved in cell wall biosynthesis
VRIVYLNPCGQLGGAETSLLELLRSVQAAAPDWEVCLVLGEEGPLTEEVRKRGVNVMVVPFPPVLARLGDARKGLLATLWSMLKAAVGTARYCHSLSGILKSLRPDIMHTNGFKMHLLGAWTRPRNTPLVWHIHDYVSTRRLTRDLLRLFHKGCTVAVVNSRSVAGDLQNLLPSLKVVPIYNAIDLERFSPAGPKLDLDAQADLPAAAPGTLRVGLVATFARWKGHKLFLETLSRLSPEAPIRGYIIGGPIYQTDGSQWSQQELQYEVERLGLRGRVGFTGFVHDIPAAMRSLDIVVHASTEPEPFGMVIIEAMGCGVPVVASLAGGAAELFTDGENAIGYPPGDGLALAREIERLASHGELRRRLSTAGRQHAERLYHGNRLATELLAVYREARDLPVDARPEPARRSPLTTERG